MRAEALVESQIQRIVFWVFLNPNNSMFTTWCSHCNKLKKEEDRKKRKDEDNKQKEKDAQEQEKIFEEARRKLVEEEQQRCSDYAYLFHTWPSYCYVYSQSNSCLNDESINRLASEKAKNELSQTNGENAISYDDLFFLHKVLMTSKEMLVAKLWTIPKDELSSFYMKNAIRLHPDKNNHPQAMEAFQKFTECYKACTRKQEA